MYEEREDTLVSLRLALTVAEAEFPLHYAVSATIKKHNCV